MILSILKKVLIAAGLIIILLTPLKVYGHMGYYGVGIIISGIIMLLAGVLIPVRSNGATSDQDQTDQVKSYPNILQSIGLTGALILMMLSASPLKLWLDPFIGEEASSLIGYLVSFGLALLIFYAVRKYKISERSFNFTIENNRIIPLISLASVALLIGIAGPISGLIPMSEAFKKILLQLAGQTGIFAFLLMVIAAPILEELIFRGIVLEGLLKRYTPSKAILVSSLLFGIVHLNPWQFVSAGIMGIFSGWVYYKTRSITPSIIIHAAGNFTGFLMRQFIDFDSMVNKPYLESYGGLRNLILLIVGSVIIFSFSIYYLKIEFNKQENKIESTQEVI